MLNSNLNFGARIAEGTVGFIGYSVRREPTFDEMSNQVVRIFLECRENSVDQGGGTKSGDELPSPTFYTYAVDVEFPDGNAPCRLRGVDGVPVLKKFYKLVNSLEERAREHGNPRQKPLKSVEAHLRYTRNARDLTSLVEPSRVTKPFGLV